MLALHESLRHVIQGEFKLHIQYKVTLYLALPLYYLLQQSRLCVDH